MDMIGGPSFIRNIVSVPRQLESLIVPEAFVKNNPTIFLCCSSVILQVPGGREFEVEIKRKGREILFSGGWKDFAEHYNLDSGYFLVFHCRGDSRFQVGIADTSDCEIDYTPYHCQCIIEHVQSEEEEHDDEEEKKKSEVRERAEMYHCDGPSFIVPMKASYLSNDYRMWVPLGHGRRYLKNGTSKVKLIVDEESAVWEVKLISSRTSMRFGWKKFMKDNKLSEHDVCKFELIDRRTQTYKVHIFGY